MAGEAAVRDYQCYMKILSVEAGVEIDDMVNVRLSDRKKERTARAAGEDHLANLIAMTSTFGKPKAPAKTKPKAQAMAKGKASLVRLPAGAANAAAAVATAAGKKKKGPGSASSASASTGLPSGSGGSSSSASGAAASVWNVVEDDRDEAGEWDQVARGPDAFRIGGEPEEEEEQEDCGSTDVPSRGGVVVFLFLASQLQVRETNRGRFR